MSTDFVIGTAFELCRDVALADLSIVQLAKEIGVTPASLHYYLDGRDSLIAGVVRRYFEMLLPCFELGIGESWEMRVRQVATALYRTQVQYKGVTSYFISHNKFRLVRSGTQSGPDDLGLHYLESMLQLFFDRPTPVDAAVVNVLQLVRFISSSAHSAGGGNLPGQNSTYIEERLSNANAENFPAVQRALKQLTALGPDEAFEGGLAILLKGFLAGPAQ